MTKADFQETEIFGDIKITFHLEIKFFFLRSRVEIFLNIDIRLGDRAINSDFRAHDIDKALLDMRIAFFVF